MQGSYKLIYEGFQSDDADDLRLFKTALVTDLGLSVDQVKSILEECPAVLMTAESSEELEPILDKLFSAGASLSIECEVEEAPEEEEVMEFEFDLEELDEAKPKPQPEKPAKVYNLEEESQQAGETETLDEETYDEVSELLNILGDSKLVAKPEPAFTSEPDYYEPVVDDQIEPDKIADSSDEEEYNLSPVEEDVQELETDGLEADDPAVEEQVFEKPKKLPKQVKLSLPKITSNRLKISNGSSEPQPLSAATVLAVAAAFFVILMTAIPGFRIQTFDEPAKELAERLAAEFIDIKPVLNQSGKNELLGETVKEGFTYTAHMYKENADKYSLRVSVVGDKPEEISELEKVRGGKGLPWLTRLSFENTKVMILPDGSFESKSIGEAKITYDGESYQIPVQSFINGRLIEGGTKSRLWLRILHGIDELEATDEERLEAIGPGEFILSISSALKLGAN